jgi:hypothetical protein
MLPAYARTPISALVSTTALTKLAVWKSEARLSLSVPNTARMLVLMSVLELEEPVHHLLDQDLDLLRPLHRHLPLSLRHLQEVLEVPELVVLPLLPLPS